MDLVTNTLVLYPFRFIFIQSHATHSDTNIICETCSILIRFDLNEKYLSMPYHSLMISLITFSERENEKLKKA